MILRCRLYGALAWVLSAVACSSAVETAPANAIRVGVLLPYSGEYAATASNAENALTQAVDVVNKAGGVAGRPLYLEVRDSRSSADKGYAPALDLLNNVGVHYIIGPQESDLALKMANALSMAHGVQLLPALTAPNIVDEDQQSVSYRLTADSQYLACALATYLRGEGVTHMNTVSTRDPYNRNFSQQVNVLFTRRGGIVGQTVALAPGAVSYAQELQGMLNNPGDSFLLATDPYTAATVTQELLSWTPRPNLVLSPALRNDLFLQNVPPSVLKGQPGVAPQLVATDASRAFADAFETRWQDVPVSDAYLHFDSVILLALALNHAQAAVGSLPQGYAFDAHMSAVTNPNASLAAPWSAYGDLLAQVQRGESVRYLGVAGAITFDSQHEAANQPAEIWTVSDREFATVTELECSDQDVFGDGTTHF